MRPPLALSKKSSASFFSFRPRCCRRYRRSAHRISAPEKSAGRSRRWGMRCVSPCASGCLFPCLLNMPRKGWSRCLPLIPCSSLRALGIFFSSQRYFHRYGAHTARLSGFGLVSFYAFPDGACDRGRFAGVRPDLRGGMLLAPAQRSSCLSAVIRERPRIFRGCIDCILGAETV